MTERRPPHNRRDQTNGWASAKTVLRQAERAARPTHFQAKERLNFTDFIASTRRD